MKRYCAFLRGVNVKGTAMKMKDVCEVFQDLGLQEVTSVLATGNILFSSEISSDQLKKITEEALSTKFDYEAFIFLKDKAEILGMSENIPFTKSEDLHQYIFITEEETPKLLLEEFDKGNKLPNEQAKIVDNVFYWQISKGNTLDSDFGKILGKKSFKDKLTSRNRNTIEKIIQKL